MKLTDTQLEGMAYRIAKHLVKNGFVAAPDEEHLSQRIEKAIRDDLLVEDKLNEEVREILAQYQDEILKKGIQYHEMFKIIKAKLVKERKLIL